MSRDKQIEKIARDLNHIIQFKDNGFVARYATAEAFYDRGYRRASEVALEVIEELERKIASLEYNAKTTRKTIKVEELRAQVDWILHEVVPDTIAEVKKKYEGDNNGY